MWGINMNVVNRDWIVKTHRDKLRGAVLEIGSLIVEGQENIAMRSAVEKMGYEFIGIDMRSGNGVDIVVDAKDTGHFIDDDSVDTIICLDTLEHVDWPRDLIRESYRIIKPGGYIFLATVMDFPIHDYPSDYWRFTPECLKMLLEDAGYKDVEMEGHGRSDFPGVVRAIGRK